MGIHNPAHPGETLKGLVLDPLGLSVTDAARCRTAY
jgi:plasmid maintenance system antidote protein VapI